MKWSLFIVAMMGGGLQATSFAEEVHPPAPVSADQSSLEASENRAANPVSLGLGMGRPTETVRAQLPSLPSGMGFVVHSVTNGGPGEKAGMQIHDVVTKLDGQWLVNEAQLLVLLGLYHAGDVVSVTFYRAGQEMTLPVTLEHRPPRTEAQTLPPLVLGPLADGQPMHVVDLESKTASVTDASNAYTLEKRGGVLWYVVEKRANGEVLFDGPVQEPQQFLLVPSAYQEKLSALRRVLADSVKREAARKPRIRRVILPKE